jgi:hypothetical protein
MTREARRDPRGGQCNEAEDPSRSRVRDAHAAEGYCSGFLSEQDGRHPCPEISLSDSEGFQ